MNAISDPPGSTGPGGGAVSAADTASGGQSVSEAGSPVDRLQFGKLQGAPLEAADYILFGAVFLVALIFRIIYLVIVSKSPLFDSPILDAEVHDRWARAIVAGETFFPGAYFKAPLYPWLLAFVYKLTGGGYLAPRIAQIVMGSLSCGFIYLLGRETFNRAVGAIAGFAAAAYWLMIFYDNELLLEPLSIFLSLISLWLIFRAAGRASVGLWFLAGLFLGLSAITRPNVLVYMPFIALWILWIGREKPGKSFIRAAAWSVACIIPILPITLRNYFVGNDLVLIASQGGPNFFIGNNPLSDGFNAAIPGSRNTWADGLADWTSMAEQDLGRKLKGSEVDKYFYDKGWEFIRTNPGRALLLNMVKLQLFFYEWEIPNDSDPTAVVKVLAPSFLKSPIHTGGILAVGLVGFFIAVFGGFKRLLPLTGFLVFYTATVVAFFVCARFRFPVMPFALVLASVVPVKFWAALRERDARTVVALGVFTYLAWIAIHRGVPQSMVVMGDAGIHQRIGAVSASKGLPGAVEEFKKALEINPDCVEAECSLAYYERARGDADAAILHFYRVHSLSPKQDIYNDFVDCLARKGRWEESIKVLRAGVENLPSYLDIKRKLAFVLATCPVDHLRNGGEALRLAKEVAAVGEEIPQTYDTLGVAYAAVGRFDEAVRAETQAARLASESGMADAFAAISERLKLFQLGMPFRQNVGLSPSPGKGPNANP